MDQKPERAVLVKIRDFQKKKKTTTKTKT